MTVRLRELAVGARFYLERTGEMHKLLERKSECGRIRYVVWNYGWGKASTLHHSCVVLPIVKPRIKLKR